MIVKNMILMVSINGGKKKKKVAQTNKWITKKWFSFYVI
jgi:hypothetical protein